MNTPYAEVIGDPIAQSKSPLIHQFWLDALEIKADYRATKVSPGEVGTYLNDRRNDPDWCGCNVTMPHKLDILPFLDVIDLRAQRVGAVNTVISRDGRLHGFNTDIGGFLEPLRDDLAQDHLFRMARILGTGGAARAIITALAEEGFTLVVAGRDPHKAAQLLDELAPQGAHHAADLRQFADPTDFAFDDREGCLDLVVNASPLGMTGQPPLAFDWSHSPPGAIAYDIVTDPPETVFLRGASLCGLRYINGLTMLIAQAAEAFEKFYGAAPPRERDPILRERLIS